MKFLFVRSNKIGSKIIQWGLGQDVSHVVVFFNGTSKEYFHSYGVGLYSMTEAEYKKFNYTVVHEIDFKLDQEKERLIQVFYYRYVKDMSIRYDYSAMLYFAWRALLKKTLMIPFPKINSWGKSSFNLCTEALYVAADSYGCVMGSNIIPATIDLAMITPKDAYYKINYHVKEFGL